MTHRQPRAGRAAPPPPRGRAPASPAAALGLVAALLALASLAPPTSACNRVYFGAEHLNNIACRCNATSCAPAAEHLLDFEWPKAATRLVRLVSSRAGARFRLDELELEALRPAAGAGADYVVELDLSERLQQVAGYGGAITDSAAELATAHLDAPLREHLLESYFGARGLNYNLARLPIGGTDMSRRPYSCADLPAGARDDFELANFRLQAEDLELKLPLVRAINALRERERRPEALRLLASSWSAPNWMKTRRSHVQGGLRGAPEGPYYAAYARYLVRYLAEFERELRNASQFGGRPALVWALTPQNEPCTPGRLGFEVVNYNSVNFEPRQVAAFARLHLVPQLLAAGRRPENLALFLWDDTLLGLDDYREHLFNDTLVGWFARGLALHWYSQGLDKLPYKRLYDARRWLPAKFSMLSTEASFISRPQPGDWSRGERYARDIIENLRAGAVGWIDWNLALNFAGGPTWSRNFLDAAVLVEERERALYKQPMYYAIGHVSRFLRERSHVLASRVYGRPPPAGPANATGVPPLEWRMVDEEAEQTSELLVAAAELEAAAGEAGARRQLGLVLLNRAPRKLRAQLNLANCKSPLGAAHGPLVLELDAQSITSLAFNC